MVIVAVHTDTVQQPDAWQACMDRLSPDRCRRALALPLEQDRRRSVCAGLALDACLRTVGLRERTAAVYREPGGRPVLAGHPAWHISLSHSGEWGVCALAEAPVGVDVEQWRPIRAAALVRRYGTAAEAAWMEARPETDRQEAFWRWWTAKESLLKAQGLGLDHLRQAALVPGEPLGAPAPWQLRHYPLPGHTLCVCSTVTAAPQVQTVFSCNSDLLR